MEISGLIDRYSRMCLKLAPLLVLALIWLWFVIAILLAGSIDEPVEAFLGWKAMI